jgi:serine/threonine protein kinase
VELSSGLVVADRFRLVRQLGKGGMGSVWLAQHTALDVPCAIKFIHDEAARSADLRSRFEREAKAAALIRSPHVVQILDHGVWQDSPYIAMEYLEGEDLGQRLSRLGVIPPVDVVAIAIQVGRALTKAHVAGLVHRDLKPANIFLVKDDDRDLAKVLDFGVAKVNEVGLDGSTKTGSLLGTPYYMSPEQARGHKGLDHRSDLWALAVVVYQCLVGKLPFTADAFGELLVKIIMDPLPIPSQVAAVPPGFDEWWLRAIARNPDERFQTAREFCDALGLATGVTVRAGDVDSSGRPWFTATGDHPAPELMQSRGGTGTVLVPPTPMPRSSSSGAAAPRTLTSPGAPIPNGMTPVGPQGLSPSGSWSGAAPTPLQQSISIPTPPRRSSGVIFALLGALLLGGAGSYFYFQSTQGPSARPAATAIVEAPKTPVTATAPTGALSATAAAAVAPPAAAESEVPSAQAALPRTYHGRLPSIGAKHAPAPSATPSATPKAHPNCDPNYTLDASGQKHFKPECFQ